MLSSDFQFLFSQKVATLVCIYISFKLNEHWIRPEKFYKLHALKLRNTHTSWPLCFAPPLHILQVKRTLNTTWKFYKLHALKLRNTHTSWPVCSAPPLACWRSTNQCLVQVEGSIREQSTWDWESWKSGYQYNHLANHSIDLPHSPRSCTLDPSVPSGSETWRLLHLFLCSPVTCSCIWNHQCYYINKESKHPDVDETMVLKMERYEFRRIISPLQVSLLPYPRPTKWLK